MVEILLLSLTLSQMSSKQCVEQCRKSAQGELRRECEKQGNSREGCQMMLEDAIKGCDSSCAIFDKKH